MTDIPSTEDLLPVQKKDSESGSSHIISAGNDLLQSVLESLNTPAFCLDTTYRYISFNALHAFIMKELYNADIRVGESLLEYQYVKEDRRVAKNNLDRALSGDLVIEGHILEIVPTHGNSLR